MSYWQLVSIKDVELSEDKETIEINHGSDDSGNLYVEINTKDMLDLLKKEKLITDWRPI